MPFSQSSRARLSCIQETTYGVTPAGSFLTVPITSHSLDLSKEVVAGSDIQSDRMERVERHGNRIVSGDIVADFRPQQYDRFIESFMFNTWDSSPVNPSPDTIKFGTTVRSLSFEDYASDIDQARLFEGCIINTAAFSIKPNAMVTATYGVFGQDMTIGTTEKTVTSLSPAATQPMDSYSGAISLGNTGGALTSSAIITGMDFSITNNINPAFIVGSAVAPELEYGMIQVDGTLTAYFEDTTLINRFLNETESAIRLNLNVPGGGASTLYSFFFPRVKFNGASTPVSGQASRIITMPFKALFDSTTGSSLVIERPAT